MIEVNHCVRLTMVAYSKQQLVYALRSTECRHLIHPWTASCTLSCLDQLVAGVRGTYKFFLVIYLVQLLLKGRKVTRAYLVNHMRSFIWSLVFGATCNAVVMGTSCVLRNVFGRFFYITLICIPGFFGGLFSIFFEAPEKQTLYTFTFVQMCVEYFVRVVERSKVVSLTRGRETLVFMFFNAMLLYLLKTDTTKKQSYWFFRPATRVEKDETQGENSRCQHPGPCWKFILKSSSKYMGIGLGIQVLRMFLTKSKLMLSEPKKTLVSFLLNKKTFELGSFLGAYIGIYDSVTCLLSQYYGSSLDHHALPAGFLAGCAYWLHPNRTIGSAVFTNTMQLLLKRTIMAGKVPALPFATEITFALSCSLLFHARFLDYEICPRFITNTISTVTDGRADDVYRKLIKIMDDFSLQSP